MGSFRNNDNNQQHNVRKDISTRGLDLIHGQEIVRYDEWKKRVTKC